MTALEHPNEWPTAAKTTLTRKIGPLPVWGWGAVVVGGLVAARLLGRRHPKAASGATPAAVAVGSPGGGYGGGGGGYGGGGGGGGGGGDLTAPSVPGNPAGAGAGGVLSHPIASSSAEGVPGFTAVSTADQRYWSGKVDANGATVADAYNPATLLARWMMRAKAGTAGTAFTQQDINIGMAYASARASAAGVTPAQLTAAQSDIAKYGDAAGSNPFDFAMFKATALLAGTTPTLQGDRLTTAPTINPLTTEQTSAVNYITGQQGGWTPANLKRITDMGYTAADLPALAAKGVTLSNIQQKRP